MTTPAFFGTSFVFSLFLTHAVIANPLLVPHGDGKPVESHKAQSGAIVPCWGLPGKRDPRALPSETLEALDAAIAAKRKEASRGKVTETFPNPLDFSIFRNGLSPAAKARYPVDLQGIPRGIPVERGEVDWRRIWLDNVAFEKAFDIVLGQKKGLLEERPEKIKSALGELNLAALELLKERLLRQQEKLTHERVLARARSADLKPAPPEKKRFQFPY